MRHYTVQYGDTPRSIARRFGIHVRQLIAANPGKPVVNVSGEQTWSAIYPGERLRVPHPHELAQFAAPPPPPPQVPYWQQQAQVQNWNQQSWQRPWQQQIPPPAHAYHPGRFRFEPRHGVHGVGAVLAGHRYEEELRRLRDGRHGYEHGGMPYGVAETGVGDAGSDAVQALLAAGDPCDPSNASLVCTVQSALGIGVDGKWGAGTAKRAQAVFAGAPGPCSPRPNWWAPAGQSNCGQGAPPPPPASILQIPTITVPGTLPDSPIPANTAPPSGPTAPPALLAMTTLDPCDPANVGAVCAAQAFLGLQPDGKWGAGSASKARALMPNAPPACSPRPGWWAPKGQSNCGGAAPAPFPHTAPTPHGGGFIPPPPGSGPSSAPTVQQSSMVPGGGGGRIVSPHGGASTLAIAGVLGALGLAGIVAVVATGSHEQIITRYRTRRAPAPAPAPTHHRAPTRRAPARRGLSRRPKRR